MTSDRDIVKSGLTELEGDVTLPEGTLRQCSPDELLAIDSRTSAMTLKERLQEARQVRAQFPRASDSVEILRQLREERAHR
jgi:hypothetical protein